MTCVRALAFLFAVWPGSALACKCSVPPWIDFPDRSSPQPRNTIPLSVMRETFTGVQLTGPDDDDVQIDRKIVLAHGYAVLELVPRHVLGAGRHQWSVTLANGQEVIEGAFWVGSHSDFDAPPAVSWAQVSNRRTADHCAYDPSRHQANGRYARVRVDVPTSDLLLLMIYQRGRLDQVTYIAAGRAEFMLGNEDPCDSSAIPLGGRATFVVRDAAGNLSAPFYLDLSNKSRRRRSSASEASLVPPR